MLPESSNQTMVFQSSIVPFWCVRVCPQFLFSADRSGTGVCLLLM